MTERRRTWANTLSLSYSVIIILSLLSVCQETASQQVSRKASFVSNKDRDTNPNHHPLKSQCDSSSEQPLGMESKQIPDSALTASSSYDKVSVGPQHARLRLDNAGGAWCPSPQLDSNTAGKEWIQIDLSGGGDQRYTITGIGTQGRYGGGHGVEYAEEFWIEYSRDAGQTWQQWRDRDDNLLIQGNSDTFSIKKTTLEPSIVGVNMIRVLPYSEYLRTVCLRLELYGCPFEGTDADGTPIRSDADVERRKESKGMEKEYLDRFDDPSKHNSVNLKMHKTMIYVGTGILAVAVGIIIIVTLIRYFMRFRRSKKHPNFYSSVDVDFITGSLRHHPHPMLQQQHPYPGTTTLISGGSSTPVYCDPDQYIHSDFRMNRQLHQVNNGSTLISMMPSRVTKIIDSSLNCNGSNSNNSNSMDRYGRLPSHHQHLMQQQDQQREHLLHRSESGLTDDRTTIPDHEYAVPDIIFKDNEPQQQQQNSRLICNPLQEAVENMKNTTHHQSNSPSSASTSSSSSVSATRTAMRHQLRPLQPSFSLTSGRNVSRFDL